MGCVGEGHGHDAGLLALLGRCLTAPDLGEDAGGLMRGIHLSTGLRAAAEMVTGDLQRSSVSASGSDVCASERMSKPGRRFSTGKPHARRLNCAATRSGMAALSSGCIGVRRKRANLSPIGAVPSKSHGHSLFASRGVDAKAYAVLDDARRQIGTVVETVSNKIRLHSTEAANPRSS